MDWDYDQPWTSWWCLQNDLAVLWQYKFWRLSFLGLISSYITHSIAAVPKINALTSTFKSVLRYHYALYFLDIEK